MGSRFGLMAMNRVLGERELSGGPDTSEMTNLMHDYQARFGAEALRELYAAKGHDMHATLEACRDILAGNKHGFITGGDRGEIITTSIRMGE